MNISVRNLSKIYQLNSIAVSALQDISVDFQAGEFTAIAGPSGSGKTTLLNLIGGLDNVTSGQILFGGQDVSRLSKSELCALRMEKIGFIFQSYNLIPVLSAAENVEYVMLLKGADPRIRREKAMSVLADVGLAGMEHRRPSDLSGGQQQRVAVARAIAAEPQLVLADEPTANLDSHTASSLLDLMAEMNRKNNITFLFSSHDPMVLSRARRIVHLHDGRIHKIETSP